jgi:hypothetical protein
MSCEVSISLSSLEQDNRRCVFDFLSASTVLDASGYDNFAYSALACFRMGMSGSASFLLRFLQEHDIGIVVPPQNGKAFAVR